MAVQNLQRRIRLSGARVRRTASRALTRLGRSHMELHVALVDDPTIRRLNARYMGTRRATDVLAFAISGGEEMSPRPARARGDRPGRSAVSAGPTDHVGSPRPWLRLAKRTPAPCRMSRQRTRASSSTICGGPEMAPALPHGPPRLLGEVIVSADTAARQARRLRVPVAVEIDLLVVHGLLHLVGYDDHDPAEARRMHEREREILSAGAAGRRSPVIPERLWAGLLDRA